MEYEGKIMEKEGKIPKNTLKNLPRFYCLRQIFGSKKSMAMKSNVKSWWGILNATFLF